LFITFVDDGPGPKRFPWANTSIIILSIVLFMKTAGRPDFGSLLSRFGFFSCRPLGIGALTGPFLHTNWATLAASMTFLFMFGRTVEDRVGPRNYLLSFLFIAWASEAAHSFFNPSSTLPLVGTMRVVTGLGVFFFLIKPWGKMKWVFSFFGVPIFEAPSRTFFVFGLWAVFLLCLTLVPVSAVKTMVSFFNIPLLDTHSTSGITWRAHAGAMAAGVLLYFVVPKRKGAPTR
jgi:membrane associated rhomboid family serine protease